ncbi:MAG: DNA alkylation repair protein [Granulosicoccus sp.]
MSTDKNLNSAQSRLRELANPVVAEQSKRFFKTGSGEYAEGDRFMGIPVPALRAQVKYYASLPLCDIAKLIRSPFHEERFFALILLVRQMEKSTSGQHSAIFEFYLNHTQHINNWDLVDCSAYKIVGVYLFDKSRGPLYRLAESSSMWERRIAIISTLHFIKNGEFQDTLKLSEILLRDEKDLMHKAVGWMLREVGNRDRATEQAFLKRHYKTMPRTMLRYAIEKFPEQERQAYLQGTC